MELFKFWNDSPRHLGHQAVSDHRCLGCQGVKNLRCPGHQGVPTKFPVSWYGDSLLTAHCFFSTSSQLAFIWNTRELIIAHIRDTVELRISSIQETWESWISGIQDTGELRIPDVQDIGKSFFLVFTVFFSNFNGLIQPSNSNQSKDSVNLCTTYYANALGKC